MNYCKGWAAYMWGLKMMKDSHCYGEKHYSFSGSVIELWTPEGYFYIID